MYIQKKRATKSIKAAEDIDDVDDVDITVDDTDADVDVDPEASDLLFEAEDVAQLVAEVTGDDVVVETDDESDTVTFTVGDDQFEVQPDGDEEILEASTRFSRKKKTVSASTRRSAGRARTIKRTRK